MFFTKSVLFNEYDNKNELAKIQMLRLPKNPVLQSLLGTRNCNKNIILSLVSLFQKKQVLNKDNRRFCSLK
jgi:hypothetical protein